MPIEVNTELRNYTQDEFHALAHQVMGIVFQVHNDLGRLMDESIYQTAIACRCETAGIVPVQREVEIQVAYRGFQKSYFMDLLLMSGMMVELKTVSQLNRSHRAQALNYLLLSEMQHGLLVNLRSDRVQKQFVSTTLDAAARRRIIVDDAHWRPANDASRRLHSIFLDLLADWGAFLQTSLYREAVVACFGGSTAALQRIPIYDADTVVGTHEVCLITDDTAFALTAVKRGKLQMADQLKRFLSHTGLSSIQWINMDNHHIEFKTL